MMVMGYYCGNSLDMTFLSTYLGVSAGVLLSVISLGREQTEAGASWPRAFYYLQHRWSAPKTAALVKDIQAPTAAMPEIPPGGGAASLYDGSRKPP
jgi:hypothetical protein